MSMYDSLFGRFRQLRWKLTLSYTGVTVGVLLTIELILLVGASILLSVLVNTGYLPELLIEAASFDFAPALRPLLTQSPPDQEGIADWLELVGTASGTSIPLTFEATDEMLVVGSDGTLLGVRPADLLGSGVVGQPLDFEAIPGLAEPLQAALAGEENVEQLHTIVKPGGTIIMAIPIRDAAHNQILGVLVAMGERPTVATLLGDIIPILAASLLLFILIAGLLGTVLGAVAARWLTQRLERVSEATLAWSQGDFSVTVNDLSGDELSQLADRLNAMAKQLQILLDTRRELAVMEERNRLARDLHDSVKQQAFAAAAQLDALQILITQNPEAARAHATEAGRLVDDLRRELTGLIEELRPVAFLSDGLGPALRRLAADWSRQNNIEVDVRIQGERSLSVEQEQTLFRIIQEALSNCARHSQATQVGILLAYEADAIKLEIADNGRGFVVSDTMVQGLGIRSMKERAIASGGALTVESHPGQGTRISCAMPVEK